MKFWYDYVKPKYGGKPKLCYIDTDTFTFYKKAEDIYSNIAKSSNYELDIPLRKGKKSN